MSSKNIEDVYPLSPMQQGMLFHSLFAPASGVYIQQPSYELHGNLDISAFERAWQQVVDRHPILRTAFVWELEKPIQIVGRHVRLPLEQHDWRGLSLTEQQKRLETFLQADRHRGFELSKAPLMRLTLIQLSEDAYQFICSHHHLLLDGWSLFLLLGEALAFYEAFCLGKDLHLKRPRPYRDYIAWLQQQDITKAKKFWQQQLIGVSAPTSLVVDRPADSLIKQEESYAEQQIQLSAAVTAALQSLARQHQLTLNTLVQGVWALLLSRYSSEKDVVFGATSSGRPVALVGSEYTIGLFINTLPVRVRVTPEESLLPWLKQLQAQQVELLEYEYSPLMEIQGWSEVPRGVPLFESIVVFENYPVDASLQKRNVNLEIRDVPSMGRTNYPLTVAVAVRPEFSLNICYDNHRFDACTIRRMLGHLHTMLTGIVANPDQRLEDLPLLTEAERYQVLVEWNNTQTDYRQKHCIHELFEAQVARTPNAIAVVFEQQLTYQELNQRANQLAHYLQKLGVGPEVLVGICVERSVEMIVGILGILKSGGAYVPLDPAYPQERLAFMLEDAQVPVLLTQERLVVGLPEQKARVICLDADWEAIAQESQENPVSGVMAKNLAYTIYTSGSTGRPKGVIVPHQALVNHSIAALKHYGIQSNDRVLQFASISFDAAAEEIFPCLVQGATLVLRTDSMLVSVTTFLQICNELELTVLDLPTAFWHQVTNELPAASWALPKSLRLAIVGGERALPQQLARWQQHVDRQVRLVNTYGPTEATIVATMWELPLAEVDPALPVTIGRAISNVQTYVLDPHLNPVPIGVPGELYIGGVGVARGYFNRPDLTALKFIPNPFSPEPGSRLYKTGDMARYLPDGNLEYLGRRDRQVKIRGFRIELGEIEAVLGRHPAVRETVVIAREDVPGYKRLVAYVVPNQDYNSELGSNQNSTFSKLVPLLQNALKEKLPEYMIPSAFVLLKALPMTLNGKLDSQALPAPDGIGNEMEKAFVAPRTVAEEVLADIWTQVLGVAQVGIHDNFFELGGDSILSLQIIAKANQAGLQLTPKQLFEHQTIASVAAVAGRVQAIQVQQSLVTGQVPLTPIQHWFFAQNLPDRHHFNQAILLQVRQALDPRLLEQTVQQLLIHHDALRLRFEQTASAWHQRNANPNQVVPFSRIDLSGLTETEQESALAVAAAEIQASLNLSAGPLVRVALFECGAHKSSRLMIVIHHLVVDGVSWRILLEDLQTAYQQLSRGEALQLPAKTTSFQQWAFRLLEYANSAAQHQRDYWLAESRRHVPRLPVDRAGGDNTVAKARIVSVALSGSETQALLQEVPSSYNTQINDVLLTALVQAFEQWTGVSSLLVDLEGHGREDIFDDMDLSRTVGWFTSIFPVRLDLGEARSPGEALKAVKEQLRGIPNRGIGYGVWRYLSSDKEMSLQLRSLPQAEVSFNYLGQFDQALSESSLFEFARESSGPACSLRGSRSYLLDINGFVAEGQLRLDWTYSEAVHRRATIESIAQGFIEALRSLIAHCQSPEAGGYTPSDFPDIELRQEQLEKALAEMNLG